MQQLLQWNVQLCTTLCSICTRYVPLPGPGSPSCTMLAMRSYVVCLCWLRTSADNNSPKSIPLKQTENTENSPSKCPIDLFHSLNSFHTLREFTFQMSNKTYSTHWTHFTHSENSPSKCPIDLFHSPELISHTQRIHLPNVQQTYSTHLNSFHTLGEFTFQMSNMTYSTHWTHFTHSVHQSFVSVLITVAF